MPNLINWHILVLILMLHYQQVLSKRNRKWKSNSPLTWECGKEFSDIQSKWLLSPIVVRGDWTASDAQTPLLSHRYNITIRIKRNFKEHPFKPALKSKIIVGEFSTAINARNRRLQKKNCLTDLKLRNKGYIFFLQTSLDSSFYRINYLPVKNTKKNRNKIRKMQCKEVTSCTKSAVVSRLRKKIRVNQRREKVRMRLTCKVEGRPTPLVYWYKDGTLVTAESHPDITMVYRKRGDTIVGRLKLAKATENHAGNYTCMGKNAQGYSNSTITIPLQSLLPVKAPQTTTAKPMSYLCKSSNSSFCLNSGNCYLHPVTGEPRCICQPFFSGLRCENPELGQFLQYLLEHEGRRIAVSGGTLGKSDNLPVLVVSILVFLLVLVILLLLIYTIHFIRRRLDYEHYRRNKTERQRHQNVQTNETLANSTVTRQPPRPLVKDAAMDPIAQLVDEKPRVPPHKHHQITTPEEIPIRLERSVPVVGPTCPNGPTYLPAVATSSSNFRQRNHSGNYKPTFQTEIRPVFDYTRTSESDNLDSTRLWQELHLLPEMQTPPTSAKPGRMPVKSLDRNSRPMVPYNHRSPMDMSTYRRSHSRSPTEHDNLLTYMDNPLSTTPARSRPYPFPGHGPAATYHHRQYNVLPHDPATLHLLSTDHH